MAVGEMAGLVLTEVPMAGSAVGLAVSAVEEARGWPGATLGGSASGHHASIATWARLVTRCHKERAKLLLQGPIDYMHFSLTGS
jgi:hypothetical protein